MSFLNLSIFLSALIGILIIAWIRSFDIYEKETFRAMFLAFLIGGAASVAIALGLYEFLKLSGVSSDITATTLGSFLFIGPVEEFSKLAGLVIVYYLIRKQFNELTDGIIYMACVALGFSITENYFYANAGENNQYLLVFRAFISTPAHIAFSVIPGYAWYRYKEEKKSFVIVIIALIAASILHGIFDAIAFSIYWNFLLLIYLYLILRQSLKIVQYTNILSPFRPGFSELFDTPSTETSDDSVCPYCGSFAPKPMFRNRYFTACKCNNCGFYISTLKDIEKIFRIFAPEYRRFNRKIRPVRLNGEKDYFSIYGVAFFEDFGKPGFFRISDVSEKLHELNDTIVTSFRKSGFFSSGLLRRIFE